MAQLSAHGMRALVPTGWEGEIYQRPPGAPVTARFDAQSNAGERELRYPPILHLATFPLDRTRGDYGGGALAGMGPSDVFVSVIDFGDESTAMFSNPIPWPLRADDFDRNGVRVSIADQSGCQRFFRAAGRGYGLYVVVGSHTLRALTVPLVNEVLATIDFA